MAKVFEGTPQEFYMDRYLRDNLQRAKDLVRKDWDMVFLYDGREGSGKSVKAMQDAYFCDPTFSAERMTFTPDEFEEAIKNATKYQSVQYDEAFTGLSSRETMSRINKVLVKMLAEIRQKNLFIFVVMPTFFDVDKYVALWRSVALIHVFTTRNMTRGYFAFYNYDKKKDLYMNGKKYYSYYKPKPDFTGRFLNHYPLDEEKYRKKKYESMIVNQKQTTSASEKRALQSEIMKRLMTEESLTDKQRWKILGISEQTFYRKKKDFKQKTKDISANP